MSTYEKQAYDLGVEAALSAASWATDGNLSDDHYARMVAMMDAGDPALYDYLPTMPNLSGEWADAPTPISLYEAVTGLDHAEEEERAGLAYETLIGSQVDAIANAWEAGVSETFETECERLIRAQIPTLCPDCGDPISLQGSGWWTHDGLPGDCWRQSMDGPNKG
jgi:hypothetical protein